MKLNRLTEKVGQGYKYGDNLVNGFSVMGMPIQKLGKLEDIESQIKMPLEIVFYALIHGVFYKNYGEDTIKHTCNLRLERYSKNEFCLSNKQHYFVFSDYGKHSYNKWAITKEELL